MKSALLAAALSIAAITSPSAPAQAQDFTSGGFHGGGFTGSDFTRVFPAPTRNQGWGVHARPGFGFDRHRHDGDRHRRHDGQLDNGVVLGGYYGGEWALYHNRSWEPDSFNDWWHDNPERAYPAWMQHNQHCDRMWYRGDTLVC